ncbi:MAG: cytochrome c-type biogenesis protein CcmH [Planctomycetota bacterium]
MAFRTSRRPGAFARRCTERGNAKLLGLVLLAGAVPLWADPPTPSPEAARRALAGLHGAASPEPRDDASFTAEQLARVHALEVEIMCGCEKENFSRTLSNCPDACANPQKDEIRLAVQAGKSDAEIYALMINRYGPKVRATPPGLWGTFAVVLPLIILLVATTLGLVAVTRWRHRGVEATQENVRLGVQLTDGERAALEREVRELG